MTKIDEANLEQQQWPYWYRAWQAYATKSFVAYDLDPEKTECPAAVCLRYGDWTGALIISSTEEAEDQQDADNMLQDLIDDIRRAQEGLQ
jgi:hypothetical protein